jgi:hypothetical protein
MWLPKERFYSAFSGKIGYLNLNFGDGAFRDGNNYVHPNDIFAFNDGLTNLLGNNVKEVNMQVPGVIPVAVDQDSPKVVEFNDNDIPVDRDEYGYGYWLRFLTAYPKRLVSGKNADWYFVSRLTINNPHQDVGFGDRLLAIW